MVVALWLRTSWSFPAYFPEELLDHSSALKVRANIKLLVTVFCFVGTFNEPKIL